MLVYPIIHPDICNVKEKTSLSPPQYPAKTYKKGDTPQNTVHHPIRYFVIVSAHKLLRTVGTYAYHSYMAVAEFLETCDILLAYLGQLIERLAAGDILVKSLKFLVNGLALRAAG